MSNRIASRQKNTAITTFIVTATVGVLGSAMAFYVGFLVATQSAQKEVLRIKQQYADAYYITMDDTGAWLGDIPGQKFYPLYDGRGNRLGGKYDTATGTE